MYNAVVTIVGMKGSGKSTFTKTLIAPTPRAIIIDRLFEYEDGEIYTSYENAIQRLGALWRQDFRIIVRFRKDWHYREYFRYLAELSDRAPARPVGLVVEEADFFMKPQFIEPNLSYLFRYGRHFKISLISIARGETDLHRDAIQNADSFVVLRCNRFSKEMRERFDDEQLQVIRKLDTLTPGMSPVKGKHYMTYPDSVDPFELWKGVQA
jgi:hypothetical protein